MFDCQAVSHGEIIFHVTSKGLERNHVKMTCISLYILYYSRILCFLTVKSVGVKGKFFIRKAFIILVALKKRVFYPTFLQHYSSILRGFSLFWTKLWIAFSMYFPLGVCGGPERTESCWVSSLHSVLGPAVALSSADDGDIRVVMKRRACFGTSSLGFFVEGLSVLKVASHFLDGLTYLSPLSNLYMSFFQTSNGVWWL